MKDETDYVSPQYLAKLYDAPLWVIDHSVRPPLRIRWRHPVTRVLRWWWIR